MVALINHRFEVQETEPRQMTKLEDIEKAVEQLSPEEMAKFRAWFDEFQADQFDAQIEADMAAGTLDRHFDEAIAAHSAGKSIKENCRL
jgi:DNA-binding GntR family transcriptional regulator